MLPVVTELYAVGPRVEDVGTATLLDHALLEARMDAHLLRVLGIVKVLHWDLAAILGAVAIVTPKSVHSFLTHADGGLHARPQIKASIIHKGRLIPFMHHHPGPGHRGQQWDEVILLCAQCQGQTVVDPGHGGHPEVGAVLVVESVAVSIHRVVEMRVIRLIAGVLVEAAGEDEFAQHVLLQRGRGVLSPSGQNVDVVEAVPLSHSIHP